MNQTLLKLKTAKSTVKRMKQPSDWEKMLAEDIPNKELLGYYK